MPTLVLDSGADCADDLFMFVRCKTRHKDGKEHCYWSVVENVRVRGGRVVQCQVLYLGEINDSQRAAWCRTIEVLEGKSGSRQMALFPEGREAPTLNCEVVRVQVPKFSTIQMVDIHLPTTDGRRFVLPRHTRPRHDHELLLHQLGLKLPEQPAPRLSV